MADAAKINAVLEDIDRQFGEMRKLQRRARLVMHSDRDTAVKRRMLQALADAGRMQRRRIDELFETLHSVAAAAGLEEGRRDGPE